jgi:hypothetical protein
MQVMDFAQKVASLEDWIGPVRGIVASALSTAQPDENH